VFINEDQNKIRRRNTPLGPWNNKAYHGPSPIKFAKISIASLNMSFPVNRRAVREKM
jgi:hypothetical protein